MAFYQHLEEHNYVGDYRRFEETDLSYFQPSDERYYYYYYCCDDDELEDNNNSYGNIPCVDNDNDDKCIWCYADAHEGEHEESYDGYGYDDGAMFGTTTTIPPPTMHNAYHNEYFIGPQKFHQQQSTPITDAVMEDIAHDCVMNNDNNDENGMEVPKLVAEKKTSVPRPRGRPVKSIIDKYVSLTLHGIKGLNRRYWEVDLLGNALSFTCNICKRIFSNAYSMKQHIRFVHFKVRPFVCERCGKTFRSAYDLRRHGTTHTHERFACLNCGMNYSSRQRACTHARTLCAGKKVVSTLSETYRWAKRNLADQWERIQVDHHLGVKFLNHRHCSDQDENDYVHAVCNSNGNDSSGSGGNGGSCHATSSSDGGRSSYCSFSSSAWGDEVVTAFADLAKMADAGAMQQFPQQKQQKTTRRGTSSVGCAAQNNRKENGVEFCANADNNNCVKLDELLVYPAEPIPLDIPDIW